jgi:hypothetical protein
MNQHNPHYPLTTEICNKVYEALEAVELDNIEIINDRHNQEAIEICEASSMDEVFDFIKVFLEEIKNIGPVQCFYAAKPSGIADRCYHPGFDDIFLFPYAWDSPSMGQRIYLKFGIRKKSKKRPHQLLTYFHLDCHEDRP